MQSDSSHTNVPSEIKQLVLDTSFRNQKYLVDMRTWAVLYKNNLIEQSPAIPEDNTYKAIEKKDRNIYIKKGPLFVQTEEEPIVFQVVNLIFTPDSDNRKKVYDYFFQLESGREIGYITKEKISGLKNQLIGNDWLEASIQFFDIITIDWLCSFMGLQQAEEIKDQALMNDYASKIFRPSVNSAESIGIGSLQTREIESYFKITIEKLKTSSKLEDQLDIFFNDFGHIPLKTSFSINKIIDDFFEKKSFTNNERWEKLWHWADKKENPISRFHICCYFVKQIQFVPNSKFEKLYFELLNIICVLNDKNSDFDWFEAWGLRIDLARMFGQFLESQLPGSNTEGIYSQAWWMSEKIASVYGNNSQQIKNIRKKTLSNESYWSQLVWQISRPYTVSSPLKYVTVFTKSMWPISILSQINNRFLDYIFQTELPNKNLLLEGLLPGMLDYFPTNQLKNSKITYAFEDTCINIVEYLSTNSPEEGSKKQFSDLIQLLRNLSDAETIVEKIKKIDTLKTEEQVFVTLAFRLLVNTNIHDTKELLWEEFFNENWLTSLLSKIDGMFVIETIFISLIEVMLQKKDQWLYYLPHLFSIVCQNSLHNQKNKDISFSCIIISCICSDTYSALKRILHSNKTEVEDSRIFWQKKLIAIYEYSSDFTKAKLRPVLLALSSQ